MTKLGFLYHRRDFHTYPSQTCTGPRKMKYMWTFRASYYMDLFSSKELFYFRFRIQSMNVTIVCVNTKRAIETKIARIASLVPMYNLMYEFQFHNRFINMSHRNKHC